MWHACAHAATRRQATVVVVIGAVLVTAAVAVAKIEVGRVPALVVALVGSLGLAPLLLSATEGRVGRGEIGRAHV